MRINVAAGERTDLVGSFCVLIDLHFRERFFGILTSLRIGVHSSEESMHSVMLDNQAFMIKINLTYQQERDTQLKIVTLIWM